MEKQPFSDRRSAGDRRKKPTSPLSLSSLFGRRRHVRREEDRHVHLYVDRYGFRYVFALLITLVLSLADAFFTLRLLSAGAEELNPFMKYFLQHDPALFLAVKYVLTVLGLTFLLVQKEYLFAGRVKVKNILFGLPFLYGLLIAYEIFLFCLLEEKINWIAWG